ncbi:MAG: beta/gamma crystallin-related protein [Rubrivivax sp.]|nr:beta/gamma crystallin-related protein [Rubrivivax sp.]
MRAPTCVDHAACHDRPLRPAPLAPAASPEHARRRTATTPAGDSVRPRAARPGRTLAASRGRHKPWCPSCPRTLLEKTINKLTRLVIALAGATLATHAAAQVTFYERDAYQGRSFTTDGAINNFQRFGFNDRASSVVVKGQRNTRWEVCENPRFRGRCVVLRAGEYPSLAAMGLNDRVSSVRAVAPNARIADNRYAPAPLVSEGSIVLYRDESFQGRSFTADAPVADFRASGFNDRASSAVVSGGRWQVCENASYGGRCAVLPRGQYPNLAAMGLNDSISSTRSAGRNTRPEDDRPAPPAPPPVRAGQVDFYENDGFQGRSFTTQDAVGDLRSAGYNDRASSAVVTGERWEVCEDTGYRGRCVVLRQGQYPSLQAMGLNDRISSVRDVVGNTRIDDGRYAPAPLVRNDYGRRANEPLYQAEVTSVRAVVDDAGRRCWVEREQVAHDRSGANVPGALLGAVIGGILGHQVGGGSGRDVATGIGVVAGAAIGGNVGGAGPQAATQDVQRCSDATRAARPTYYDVTYRFRGQDFRVQLAAQPGATVTVNGQGEPRA